MINNHHNLAIIYYKLLTMDPMDVNVGLRHLPGWHTRKLFKSFIIPKNIVISINKQYCTLKHKTFNSCFILRT